MDSGIEAAPVLSYVKSKGLYGGAQVDGKPLRPLFVPSSYSYLAAIGRPTIRCVPSGNIIIERSDENKRFYGRPIKASEILDLHSRTEVPAGSEPLHIAIAAAEGLIPTAQLLYPDILRRLPPNVSPAAQMQDAIDEDVADAGWGTEDERIFRRGASLDEPRTPVDDNRRLSYPPASGSTAYKRWDRSEK